MLNFIGVNFKACTLGQKDLVIYNGFVYHVAPALCHAAITSIMWTEYRILRT